MLSSDSGAADDGQVGDEEEDIPADVHDQPIAHFRPIGHGGASKFFDCLTLGEDSNKGGSDGQLGEDDQVH